MYCSGEEFLDEIVARLHKKGSTCHDYEVLREIRKLLPQDMDVICKPPARLANLQRTTNKLSCKND